MWFIPTKKEIKKELVKIKESFSFRDKKLNDLNEKINSQNIKISKIEGLIQALLNKSEPNSELKSEPNQRVKPHYEALMIKRAKKTRPEALKQAIRGCIEKDMRTIDIYNLIVEEKKIISKTQFYHYLSLVRSELRSVLRTELRSKLK